MESKKRLVFSILDFLKTSTADGSIKPDDIEGVDVAIQCLGEAFGVNPDDKEQAAKYTIKPTNLMTIFEVFVNTQKKMAANKGPNAGAATGTSETTREDDRELTAEQKKKAEVLKNDGNKKMAAREYDEAIRLYDQAIEIDGSNAVYYANRAAAYSQAGNHEKAVEDSKKAAEVDSGYSKAYSRLGHAYFSLGRYQESIDAYTKGLELDPENITMQTSLQTAQSRLSSSSAATNVTRDSAPSSGGMPDLSSWLGGLGGAGGAGGGMPDIASMLRNPEMMRMAQQAMQNPEMMRMAQQMMSGRGGGEGGNPLAGMMNNPEMMNMAQQFLGGAGRGAGGR